MGSSVAAAAEIICGNEDLVAEILERLPAKSLIRFRSVSKTWLSLISTHRFSLLHWKFHGHPKISGFIFSSKSSSTEYNKYIPLLHSESDLKGCNGEENKSLPDNDMNSTKIIDSCNGFLLIFSLTNSECTSSSSYHVYNPTTNQISTLPWPFSHPTTTTTGEFVYLVFDPLKSLHFKVVLLQTSNQNNVQIHIYSSKTNAWCIVDLPHSPFPAPLSSLWFNKGVYCNGSIHWIFFPPRKNSMYFDVDQQILCPMPCPPFLNYHFWHFGESRGHLHLAQYIDYGAKLEVLVSEMENDYSKWRMKYRIDLRGMMVDLAKSQEMAVHDDAYVLSFIHGQEGQVFLVLFVGTNMIISYNINNNTFQKLDDVPPFPMPCPLLHDYRSYFELCRLHPYIETLFPV